ncbi:MAG TPA: hypothetical protein VFK44_07220 [Bacillales bacterium]|nr:hypothetical protein [Bacillales bacterium]
MVLVVFVIFAVFALLAFNHLANTLCVKKNLSKDKQKVVFRWFNVLVTIWLVSSYCDIFLSIQ